MHVRTGVGVLYTVDGSPLRYHVALDREKLYRLTHVLLLPWYTSYRRILVLLRTLTLAVSIHLTLIYRAVAVLVEIVTGASFRWQHLVFRLGDIRWLGLLACDYILWVTVGVRS